jgi:hypothetical protein
MTTMIANATHTLLTMDLPVVTADILAAWLADSDAADIAAIDLLAAEMGVDRRAALEAYMIWQTIN